MDQKDIIQNQLHRVVEVYQPDTNRQGSGFRGSGFAVTSNLILTANHVVQYSQQVYLRGLGWPDFYEAQVVWRSESWDAALVNVVNAPWVYALDPSHLRWMHIAGETPVRWVAYGFPRVAQLRSQKGYELEALTGFVIPGAGQKQGMLVLNISSALPREDTKSDSPWSGISGAAILTEQGHHLLGFVSHDPPHFQVSRLEGIPVERLTTDPGFVRLVGIEHTEAYHVPSPLPPPSSTPFMQKRGRFIDQLRPEYDKRLQERLPGATKMSLWVRPLTNGLPDASALALLSIVQAYENAGAGLLVLGAPGSGKSILLLELAQKLLTRAKQDPTQPVPVLVNLSSWADKKRPLDLWLRDRLWPEYGIGPDLTQRAIEEDRLIFLLDGFDEVEGSARSNCIQEIIAYRKKQLIPIVLCSRKEEFEEHKGQLKLPLMVEVQPLTSQQVDEYLTIEGTSLATLRSVLQSNNVLRGLLTTPLMLGVAMQTYSNTQVKEFPQQGSAEQQQRQVFDHYVTRALETHSTRSWRYTSDQTRTWLIWLAKQMQQRGFTEFYVEQLQFSWVSLNHSSVWMKKAITPRDTIRWPWKFVRIYLGCLLPGALFLGLLIGVWGLFTSFSFKGPGFWLGTGLTSGLAIWLGAGLLAGLRLGLAKGSFTQSADIENRMKPNQGIQKSGWNALIIGLFTLLGTGLACPLSLTLATSFSLFVDDPNLVPLFALLGLIIGLLAGAVLGWRQGGADYLAHYRLRYHLWKSGATPWRYVHFLEEAAERVLLHRVGSGYRYVHPLFQEYFASLEPSWSNLPNIKKVFTNLKVMSLVFLPILCLLIVFGSLGLWNVYQTQSTALVYQKLYQQATSGMPVLDDTLNQQSKNNWDLHRSPSQSCGFRNGSYHASTIHSAVVCPELSQQFDNFALQVNMTLTGDVGGIFFRIENDTDGYIFYIDKELELCAFARVRDSIFLTKFTCILNSPGYTEITLIIRKSSFYSYMNGHFIGYATDSALKGSGLIGFGADDRHHSTDATYSHVKIWQL